MSTEDKQLYQFGSFLLDPVQHVLLHDGVPVPLTPKAFETLQALVRHSGHVVSKDDLMKEVWPDSFVEEGGLARNVSVLRKTLSESDSENQYIETLPKIGYRFVTGVTRLAMPAGNLTVEKHTTSRIVTLEESGWSFSSPERLKLLSAKVKALPARARYAVAVIVLLTIGLTTALAYIFTPRTAGTRSEVAAFSNLKVRSIAVLPFTPLGPDNDEMLRLGMADALISKLGSIHQITVRPTSAVRKYLDPNQDSVAAGHELRVDAVLAGSIQRVDDRIRVRVQLLSVKDEAPIWTREFDEKFTNIFAVQDSISEQVTRTLMIKLKDEDRERMTKRHTVNPEAYKSYLMGRYFWNKRSVEGFTKGIEHFQEAITIDPNYALAYSGIADCYATLGGYKALPSKEAYPKALEAAAKALELDDSLAEAHASLAHIEFFYRWNWPNAEKEFKRAIELNPNYATAHQWYSTYLTALGRFTEANAEIEKARELDPLSLIIGVNSAAPFYSSRQYDKAIERLHRTLEMDSNFVPARYLLALAYSQNGMYDETIAECQKVLKVDPANLLMKGELAHAYAMTGRKAESQKALGEIKRSLNEHESTAPYDVAMIYVGLGDKEQAFAWLEKTYRDHDNDLVSLAVDPKFDPLRSDPRFADLLRRIGFAQ